MPAPALIVSEPPGAEPDTDLQRVPERAIQDAWVEGLFDVAALRTTDGAAVEVLRLGRLNPHSGPDVTGVRLRVDGLDWAGDVEIHRTSAEWEAHGHHRDPAYDRVVLHVVLAADRRTGTLRRADGSALPEVVLLPHLDTSLRGLLLRLSRPEADGPACAPSLPDAPPPTVTAWLRRLGEERLRARAAQLGRDYGRSPHLDAILVRRAFRALGYAENADAMEALAGRAPLPVLRRSASVAEARWFLRSLSGLADGPDLFEPDPESAVGRFVTLQRRLGVPPLPRELWRHGGRPANAPETRIDQAAALVGPGGPLRRDVVAGFLYALHESPKAAIDRLRVSAPEGRLGESRARAVFRDAVLPVLMLHADLTGDVALEARVVAALASLPPASDRVTRPYEALGVRPASALEAHGLHQLAAAYCDEGRCARCQIGTTLYPALRPREDGRRDDG